MLYPAVHFVHVNPAITWGAMLNANEGVTTPWYCNLYVHAREPPTFQDMSGPL